MKLVQKINQDPIQKHTLEFSRGTIELQLRFLPVVQIWVMNVEYTKSDAQESEPPIYGVKMAVGVTHIRHRNWPFDFVVTDATGEGVDPFRVDDFTTGRCELYFVTPEEMITIRGADVQ